MPIMSSTIPPAEPEVVPQEVPDSPEAQVPHNDQTSSPINTTGPIVADDFSVCAAERRTFRVPCAHSVNRMKVVSLGVTDRI